jgi:phage terminase small subunit
MPKLKNRKHEHFAVEVASMTPPDRAYLLAGFKDSKWARYNAQKLANSPAVAVRLAELQREFAARAQLHVEYLQRLLLPLVEANPQDLFTTASDATGQKRDILRPITELPRPLAAAIQRIKLDPESGAVAHIDFYNKVEAGSTLLRSVGGLVDRMQVDDISRMSDRELNRELLGGLSGYLRIAGAPAAIIEEIEARLALADDNAADATESVAPNASLPAPRRTR